MSLFPRLGAQPGARLAAGTQKCTVYEWTDRKDRWMDGGMDGQEGGGRKTGRIDGWMEGH